MSIAFPEPGPSTDTAGLFCDYLDFYRATVERKLSDLTYVQLTSPILPSGWTLLGLLKHLVHMERRWMVWGIEGQPVHDPWADSPDGPDGPGWQVGRDDTLDRLLLALHEGGRHTRQILAHRPLDSPATTGGRFETDPPSVLWVCFHVLQEYARHAGHLDAARELVDGATGE